MDELLVRSLTPEELANRLLDHGEPAVCRLARMFLGSEPFKPGRMSELEDSVEYLESELSCIKSDIEKFIEFVDELGEWLETEGAPKLPSRLQKRMDSLPEVCLDV